MLKASFDPQFIKISNERPIIMDEIERRFPSKECSWDGGVIVAFHPFIYRKSAVQPEKIVHENCHLRTQENMGVKEWWARYFDYPEFRLGEEICAYAEEASFVRETVKDRNLRYRMIRNMALALSSDMYGKLISFEEALSLIDPSQKPNVKNRS